MRVRASRYGLTVTMILAFLANAYGELGAVVVIEKHPTGADLVEIAMVDPNAREEDLASRVSTIADGRRGTQIVRDPLKGSMDKPALKATFAVDGWLKADGTVRLAPITAALCAPGQGRVDEIRVVIEKFRPGSDVLTEYRSGDLLVKGARFPDGYEYRIVSGEGDTMPPDKTPAPVVTATPPPTAPDSPPWSILIVTALAAGALVYSAILYRRRSARYGRSVGKPT